MRKLIPGNNKAAVKAHFLKYFPCMLIIMRYLRDYLKHFIDSHRIVSSKNAHKTGNNYSCSHVTSSVILLSN